MKRSILFLLCAVLLTAVHAQTNPEMWTNRQAADLTLSADDILQHYANEYRLVELAPEELSASLLSADHSIRQVTLPKPDGSFMMVKLRQNSVMAPELAARYPGIQTYEILGDGGKILGGRAGWTYQGFHATVLTTQGTIYIDPYARQNDRYYTVYNVEGNMSGERQFECKVEGGETVDVGDIYDLGEHEQLDRSLRGGPAIVQRRYRLAMAATSEFSAFNGGTLSGAMSAIVAIVDRVNEVYGRELGIQFELVANNDDLIFLDAATEPYQSNIAPDLIETNQEVVDEIIGTANYDVGHVVSQFNGVSGLASLRSACITPRKASGTSTLPVPQGDPFVIAVVCHELGHQFGATHTQSGCQNVSIISAVEPGGGTTIMGYAGICPSGYNIQSFTDEYFNNSSLAQIFEYSRNDLGNACAQLIDEGNTIPEVTHEYENGFFIPISTPFELTAAGTDMEDDNLKYCWEQRDIYEQYPYNDEENMYGPFPGFPIEDSPIFRTFPPTTSPTRVFPRIQNIINNTTGDISEVLPTYSRPMNFRCTVRDYHPTSGGASWAAVSFQATEMAGPFLVMAPNTGSEVWSVGDYVEVSWDVANTTAAPVNCARVNIRLSTDGGLTYPVMLLADTPNDGTAFVTVPDEVTSDARVRVEAADNIFFDISNEDFDIVAATEGGYTLDFGPLYQEICVPGESATVEFVTASILGYDSTVTLEVLTDLASENIVASFDNATIQPGATANLTLDFSNSAYDGPLAVEVQATTADMGTTTRVFDLEIYNADFSALELQMPADGTGGVGLSTDFSWNTPPASIAQGFDFELATSPLFGDDVVDAATGLAEGSYSPIILFEPSTLYFWRVRAVNECGPGEWSSSFTFHTENTICEGATSTDTPITIPGSGPLPTRTSSIFVDFQGTISDINIPFVNVRYQPIQNFQIRLRNPMGDAVLLYDGDCFSTDRVNVGFDDDAPQMIQCPPTNQIVYQPSEDLSAFIGQESQGEWKLEVQVLETGFGAPGELDDWAIEFCASSAPDSPTLDRNEELCVRPNEGNPVNTEFLIVSDPSQNNFELEYTVVTTPAFGDLYFQGEVLEIGSTFRQSSVEAGNVTYVNTDETGVNDNFSFVVEDGTGGFLPVTTFNILIDGGCITSNEELTPGAVFTLYPNPTNGQLTLQWGEATDQDYSLRVFNVQGQLLQSGKVARGTTSQQLDLSNVPAGIYLVQIGQHVERVVVE